MQDNTQTVSHLEQAAREAASHGGGHAAHELPNFVNLLKSSLPHAGWVDFLLQWENVLFSLIVMVILITLFKLAMRQRALIPKLGIGNLMETVVEGLENFVMSIMGPRGRKHVPFIGTLFLYILLMNWSGLIPFSKSPTSSWSTTIALAVISVIYIHASGIKALGFGHYLHHLAGNPQGILPWLIGAILILPLNIILELGAVPFSLSLRLFANISSEDSLLYNFAQLNAASHFVAIPLQVFANILAVLFSIIQAFVFTLLTTVYISLLMPHEEHENHAHGEGHAEGHSVSVPHSQQLTTH